MSNTQKLLWKLLSVLFKPHPHGERAPDEVNCSQHRNLIAVLRNDAGYGSCREIEQVPEAFLTCKQAPGSQTTACRITYTSGRADAEEVIVRSLSDYRERFGDLEEILTSALNVMQR